MSATDIPSLEIGFAIRTEGSFESLAQLDRAMASTEAKVLADASRIEKATASMVNLGGATAQITTFGNATSRAAQSAAQDFARIEKSGEALVRRLERENGAYGKSRSELRAMRAEEAALAADRVGNADLAQRIRAQESALYDKEFAAARAARLEAEAVAEAKTQAAAQAVAAADREATAVREAAFAYQMFEARVRQGAAAMKEQAAAETAAAAARADLASRAERLVNAIDPAAAAQSRFNREMSEARVLIGAGVISLDQYSAKLQVEQRLLAESGTAHGRVTASMTANRMAMQGASYQVQDFITQVSMGANPINAFAVQGAQLAGQFSNIEGKAGAVARFFMGPWGLAITAGLMLAGMFADKLFEGASAADRKAEAAKELESAINSLAAATRSATQSEHGNMQATLDSARALRQKALDTRAATIETLAHARAQLATALAESARPDPSRGQDGGIDFALTQAGQLEKRTRQLEAQLAKEEGMLRKSQVAFREAEIPIMRRRVTEATDASAAATGRYERAMDALNRRYGAGKIGQQEYMREAGRLGAVQTSALKSIEDAEKSAKKAGSDAARARKTELREEAKAAREAARAHKELEATFTGLQGRFDPAAAAGRELGEALKDIDRLKAAKMIGEEEFLAWRASAYRAAADRSIAAEAQRMKEVLGDLPDLFADRKIDLDLRVDLPDFGDRLADPELWDIMANNAANAARGMEEAFGGVGRAIGDLGAIYAGFNADRTRLDAEFQERIAKAGHDQVEIARLQGKYAAATSTRQIGLYGDMAKAAKSFFGENTAGYKAMETAEKVFRAVEFALSVRAIAQDAIETGSAIAKSTARTAAGATEAVVNAIKSLPFPLNIAAGAATVAALAGIGVSIAGSFGGGRNTLAKANEGQGTVLGDAEAKSESIRRAIDSLKEVDTLMLSTSREMAGYLRSIESQIGGVAALVVRAGNIDANAGVQQGFKANAIGGLLGNVPLIGGFLKSLFGSTTTVIGSGLYGGAQSLGSILGNGFDASYYSDVEKKKKFLGITTGKSYSTQYSGADAGLENQFTLILRGFNDAIRAAAGPLGASTDEIEQRLNGFIVNIGKIDTKGLTGEQIEEKLTAVFGAAADGMAAAAIPGIERFQKVGEGAFETLIRVASTVETVTSALNQMGFAARNLSIDAKLGVADQFDSARDFATAADAYVRAYYTKAEQNAAMLERFGEVFVSLGVTMPRSLADFRALVEAQDLTSASGQATYATLLKLAPAFADLMSSMEGAKSAADVLAERQDLKRKLLELNGDTVAIRALDLAKLDASNRALQQQIWAIQDAQEAARAAEDLRKAWTSVGDSIMDEVKRIRGLDGETGEVGFAALMGRFNAATLSARAGDQDAAKSLPGLSQELLRAAGNAARTRQELDRVRAETAASLEETYAAINRLGAAKPAEASTAALLTAMQNAPAVVKPGLADEPATHEVRSLRDEVAQLREAITSGLAVVAGNTGKVAKHMDNLTSATGGDALAMVQAA